MDRARYAVDAVMIEGRSLRAVASSLDMSKSWVAKQVTLFRAGGYEALAPKSKAPHRRPPQLDPAIENEIVLIRKQLFEDGFDAGPFTEPWSGVDSWFHSHRSDPARTGCGSRRACRTKRGRPT